LLLHGVNANLLRRWVVQYGRPWASLTGDARAETAPVTLLPVTTQMQDVPRALSFSEPRIEITLSAATVRVRGSERVERLYELEKLHIRRRRRKKTPVADRQPLIRPGRANGIWSVDFVFDRVAPSRTLKCLAIVDDATHEAVALVPEQPSVVNI
jgi:transposase-like protein